MNYIYALTYVNFDQENKDVVYFKNQSEKDSYFGLSSLFDSTNKNEINFEKKNLLDISLTIATTDTNKIKDEFGFNYCIIKEISSGNYYFYFVNRILYDNIGRLRINCHLDIFTTYFDSLSFDGLIKRATFREFKKDTDSTDIIYDNGQDTHIYSIDDTYKGKKFLQYDKTIHPHIVTNYNDPIDTWMENNIDAWMYLFVDCNHTFNHKVNGFVGTYRAVEEFMSNGVLTSYGIIVQPIYKGTNKMYVRFTDVSDPDNPITHNLPFNESSVDQFRKLNNDNAYVYSSKLSKQPPFTPFEFRSNPPYDPFRFLVNVIVSGGNLYFDFGNITNINDAQLLQVYTKMYYNVLDVDDSKCEVLFEYTYQTKRFFNCNVSSVIQSYIKTRMTKTYYLNTLYRDYYKYPNATSLKNIELKITYNGQEYTTSPSKIDTGKAYIEMLETISADITKIYVRWESTGAYAFTSANDKTLTGGIFSDDTSLPLGTSKLAETLAQSKNFFLQKQINLGTNFLMNLGGSIAKQDVVGVAKSMAKTQLDEVNYGFEVDNIENAPSHLQKANGNSLFNLLTKDYGIHLEIWMMTNEDLTNVADYYNRFGQQSHTIGNTLQILEKHKYFDYTEFEVYKVNGTISNEIKEEFKKKLSRGVRFWYSDLYNYSKYNYEKALE